MLLGVSQLNDGLLLSLVTAKMNPSPPPFTITAVILSLVEQIGEALGRISTKGLPEPTPQLRRQNRIKTIQASLAIENNTLTLDQVTAVLDGKRVLGLPREIQEVKNAFAAYEKLDQWEPAKLAHLLEAHGLLTAFLIDHPGQFRSGGVGIKQGDQIVHLAPPADRVPGQIANLLAWLKASTDHPLIKSCVFHYEFEFIHPFEDGNGRLGRLWQTLILSQWKPLFLWLPVETIVRDRQADYYRALGESDASGQATSFIEFMLGALLVAVTDQATVQVTDQVQRLLECLGNNTLSAAELMDRLDLSHAPTFRQNYLNPALAARVIERTDPASPRSPRQKYKVLGEK